MMPHAQYKHKQSQSEQERILKLVNFTFCNNTSIDKEEVKGTPIAK